MLKRKPIFLFAFSNAYHDLPNLKQEESSIRDTLSQVEDLGKIEFRTLGGCTLDDVFKTFNRFHNDIVAFHYGGHSGDQFLELEDRQARAYSLADLLGTQNSLQLVFLNGCSNKSQVERLLAANVKTVIATNCPIGDESASIFANQFYQALGGGKNIQEAFDTAKAYVQNDLPDLLIENHRGIGRRGVSERQDLPWGLYSSTEADLEWTIPEAIELPENPDLVQEIELVNPDINKKMVGLVLEGMAKEDESHLDLFNKFKDSPANHLNTAQNSILDNFPLVLSIQIRDLFTPEGKRKGRQRLKMLNDTYLILGQLLLSFVLAKLWENVIDFNAQEKPVRIRDEFKSDLKAYLSLTKDNFRSYDYFWLVGTVSRILEDNKMESFVHEFEELKTSILVPDQYYQAYRFLEQELRMRLNAENIDVDEIEYLCEDAEKQLGLLLQKCAFLTTYQFLTINDIEVDRKRNQTQATFIHNRALLKGRDASTLDESPLILNDFIFNQSVIIAKEVPGETPVYINLSPFIIDENAYKLKSEQSKIYFFGYRGANKKDYYYRNSFNLGDKEFKIAERYSRRKYRNLDKVIQQFEAFEKDLNL